MYARAVASTVLIDDDVVTLSDPDTQPSIRRLSLAEAWEGSGRMLFVHDPDRLVDLLRTLARPAPRRYEIVD